MGKTIEEINEMVATRLQLLGFTKMDNRGVDNNETGYIFKRQIPGRIDYLNIFYGGVGHDVMAKVMYAPSYESPFSKIGESVQPADISRIVKEYLSSIQ